MQLIRSVTVDNMLKKIIINLTCLLFTPLVCAKAIIDPDVKAIINKSQAKAFTAEQFPRIATLIFLHSQKEVDLFIADLKRLDHVSAQKFTSIPALLVLFPKDQLILETIANHPAAMQISSFHGGQEELEFSEQAILLRPSDYYPNISNWWDNGYTGQHTIIGLIDSGVASEHPSLNGKQIIIRKEAGSGYAELKNGVRTPHGTGVACIYAGSGNTTFPNDTGIARGVATIITGLAGEGDGNMEDLAQTLSTLDWMLDRAEVKPNLINYSFGNGMTNCPECPDWSGLAKVVDYVVNHHHILWVKSAGNNGYIAPSLKSPYASTMTSPADNYNAITVANMNPTIKVDEVLLLNPNRDMHAIRYTSSLGPTLNGRKKPDISAPGNDTRTCAPDPAFYSFSYTKAMDYYDGYRLMGGTSSAAPHVGAAALLLHDGGIVSPMAKKALLINSADAYTDSGKSGPDNPKYPYEGGHYPVMGREWNRTYGWGYLNMQRAYEERNYLIQDKLTLQDPEKIYEADLPIGAKITLVHERRVGFSDSQEWQLSHLRLEIIDRKTKRVIMRDNSPQDTVHQVANCRRRPNEKLCSSITKPIQALIRVRLMSPTIDGSNEEPFALASSVFLLGERSRG
jgi:serine protease AprX